MRALPIILLLGLLASLAACQQNAAMADPLSVTPVRGFVTDLEAFQRFVAARPTPAQLARAYPDLTLVLPGQIATRELRMNNSRYFAELDAEGRIVGGRFM